MVVMNMIRAMHRPSRVICGFFACIAMALHTGCGELLQRRVEVPEPTGADPELEERFGLTGDAQDPTERDTQLGYGRWKHPPESEGTKDPKSPDRRGRIVPK